MISTIVEKIYQGIEKQDVRKTRAHLGCSEIGGSCRKQLWYTFRWAWEKQFDGRMLRLFRRGELEENYLIKDLRNADAEVDETSRQHRMRTHGGHFGGRIDGAGKQFEDSATPDAWHLLEFKTANDSSFKRIKRIGVAEAMPAHYAQVQCYMHLSGVMKITLYLVVNKNNDEIYSEYIEYNEEHAKQFLQSAEDIIFSDETPLGLPDPTWRECSWCVFKKICWEDDLPEVNCRTCTHAVVERKGNANWSCALTGDDLSIEKQKQGCEKHLYLAHLITYAELEFGSENENWQQYKLPDGRTFRNGMQGPGIYTSKELQNLPVSMIGDKEFENLRTKFEGTVEKKKIDDGYPFDDDIPF